VSLDEVPRECRNTPETRRLRELGQLPAWGWLPVRQEDALLQPGSAHEKFELLVEREPRLRILQERARTLAESGNVKLLEDGIDPNWLALRREIDALVGPRSGSSDPLVSSHYARSAVTLSLGALVYEDALQRLTQE
jgi:hypothetical protein